LAIGDGDKQNVIVVTGFAKVHLGWTFSMTADIYGNSMLKYRCGRKNAFFGRYRR